MPADNKIRRSLSINELLVFTSLLCCCMYIALTFRGACHAGVFDLGEITVAPSPTGVKYLELKSGEKVSDFSVARNGPETAVLVEGRTGGSKVLFWDLSSPDGISEWPAPRGFTPRYLAWHPVAKSFFLAGKQGKEHVIMRVDKKADGWATKIVYRTQHEIRRLLAAPRPYALETDFSSDEPKTAQAYRIFFGLKNPDGTYSIKSVTEDGGREYQAIGSKKGFTIFKDSEVQPSAIEAPSALPLAFHPAGHILLWEDGNRDFQYAVYERDHWARSVKLAYPGVFQGTLTATPNGLGLIHWLPDSAGITLIGLHGGKKDILAAEHSFFCTPLCVPDGKGIVGPIKKDNGTVLAYVPVEMPLADVANAWMFSEDQGDRDLLSRKGGLLRDLPYDQLYSMYESEAYDCGQYDRSTPTRPYLVTTDIFWELLGAAYEGVFIIKERQRAIPAFWKFVDEADAYFRQAKPDSPWMKVFAVLEGIKKPVGENDDVRSELLRIQKAGEEEYSPLLGTEVDYAELKPRGHYTSSEDMSAYFKAFKYMTIPADKRPEDKPLPVDDLINTTPEIRALARSWISTYNFFIAPSRGPVVWGDTTPPPSYAKHPLERMRLFPLSWGFDNEVLFSTVFHGDLPEAEQITGPSGNRLIPSGLDVASALGSKFATSLLATEIKEYPPLGRILAELRTRLSENGKNVRDNTSMYNPWMEALGLQWADDTASPGGTLDKELWLAKRLQTGLASWATLRHATVLVNERTSAECGEAAFEPILLTPPRGYVEPDPKTFDAIANLFQSMEDFVQSSDFSSNEKAPKTDDEDGWNPLKEGIVRRLSETAAKAKLFKTIAEKEIRGEPLSDREYEEILLVGRIAEHHLLIFKSLASKDHALSNPDPMPKITDAAGGGPAKIPFLMAAVGRPMEWDHIVPYFGRRQIAKGAVYSYYEFTSKKLMDDAEWLGSVPSRQHPSWISVFVSGSLPACPPRNPY